MSFPFGYRRIIVFALLLSLFNLFIYPFKYFDFNWKIGSVEHGDVQGPIDLVYTWVNGSDPEHLRLLKLYSTQKESPDHIQTQASKFFDFKDLYCHYRSCIRPNNMLVIIPMLSEDDLHNLTLSSKMSFEPYIYKNMSIESYDNIYHNPTYQNSNKVDNISLLTFNNLEFVQKAIILKQLNYLIEKTLKYKVYIGYVTLDCDSSFNCVKNITRTFLGRKYSNFNRVNQLPERIRSDFVYVKNYHKDSTNITLFRVKSKESEDFIKTQFSNDFSEFDFYNANLVWDLGSPVFNDLSQNRFTDNNELKFSLRSIERFAPWVRNIYIVTSGHYPNWLNVSNPRIKLVKHSDIFTNLYHLPTFNSPAIESHLHRIKGLSDNFLYSCDDYFFGQPVSLQDFYTKETGFKLRMADWTVPECSSYCLRLQNNNKCNSECNSIECNFDGNECKNDTKSRVHSITYMDSIKYVSSLFNRMYGYQKRRGINHIQILVNKKIMEDLQSKFSKEFAETSSHRFRDDFDLQYPFTYFNFLISEREEFDVETFFKIQDLNQDKYLSLDELKLNENYSKIFKTCAKSQRLIDLKSFLACKQLINYLNTTRSKPKYKTEILNNREIRYKLITNNEFYVKVSLDNILASPLKIICLNDIIDHKMVKEATRVAKIRKDFYLKMFPNESQFELKNQKS